MGCTAVIGPHRVFARQRPGWGNFFVGLCLFLAASAVWGQAVTETPNRRGMPLAIVETPGGDVEHLAVALPATSVPASHVAGFPVDVAASSSHRLVLLTVPAVQAAAVAAAVGQALEESGALAAVALGPTPARELLPLLDDWPAAAPLPAPRCPVVDGAVQVVRGTAESVELTFAAPGLADPQFDQLPALAGWLQRGLMGAFPGLRVEVVVVEGCASLAVRAPASEDEPRALLERLRGAVRARADTLPDAAELALVARQLERARLRWAVDGRGTVRDLVARLVFGASVAGALADPLVDREGLSALTRRVFAGHAGAARVVEREQRGVGERVVTLDNGVTITVAPLASQAAAVAVALSGLAPASAGSVLRELAARAAAQGWYARLVDVLGVPAAGVVAPAAEVDEVLETAGEILAAAPPRDEDRTLAAGLLEGLGLSPALHGGAVAVAIGAPGDPEEAGEAAAKFLASLPAPPVTVHAWPVGTPLQWTVSDGRALLVAVAEFVPSVVGLVAGEAMRQHLAERPGVRPRWLAGAGRVALVVEAEADGPLPTLDAALANAWQEARQRVDGPAVARAARGLVDGMSGDLLQAVARRAAAHHLSVVARPEALLAVEPSDVHTFLTALPPWQELRRVGRGPAPPPAGRGVRESPPRP